MAHVTRQNGGDQTLAAKAASAPNPPATLFLGPLTTPFVPASSCLSWTFNYSGGDYIGNNNGTWIFALGQNRTATPFGGRNPNCFPTGFDIDAGSTTVQYYSPGRCPVDYTAASTSILPVTTLSGTQQGNITAVDCCPR